MRKIVVVLAVLLLALVTLPALAQRPPCGHPPEPPCRMASSDVAATAPVTLAQGEPAFAPAAALGLVGLGLAGFALVRRLRPKLPVEQ